MESREKKKQKKAFASLAHFLFSRLSSLVTKQERNKRTSYINFRQWISIRLRAVRMEFLRRTDATYRFICLFFPLNFFFFLPAKLSLDQWQWHYLRRLRQRPNDIVGGEWFRKGVIICRSWKKILSFCLRTNSRKINTAKMILKKLIFSFTSPAALCLCVCFWCRQPAILVHFVWDAVSATNFFFQSRDFRMANTRRLTAVERGVVNSHTPNL